jgi:uncharacterized membrane protein
MNKINETKKRSIVKSTTYRIIVVATDFSVLYLLTGKTEISVVFTVISNTYTWIFYYLHERIWNRIRWGRATG